MRPWFYYNGLGARIYDAGEITRHVTGNWFGEHYCMNIYDDPRLYSPYNKHKSKTNYIYLQDYKWILSVIAPTPEGGVQWSSSTVRWVPQSIGPVEIGLGLLVVILLGRMALTVNTKGH